MSKARARIDLWAKELAPSTELRKWFAHDPGKWDEFQHRYRHELANLTPPLREIAGEAEVGVVTLLFGARDELHNEAVVLKDFIERLTPLKRG